ncbi:MAG TPA: homogentisate phytyltransferase [Egibacteraceae bacterium]|nr:homogentisate phytyltransferase [Egibacteraceae bacterium]
MPARRIQSLGWRAAGGGRLSAFVGFSRPHTIVGTVVSVCALFVLARFLATPRDPSALDLVTALLGGLAVNVYIVGLNQLTDVDLDRVNKPWLPLPAGSLAQRDARLLVAGALAAAAVIGALGGPWLLGALTIAAVLGTAYSVRPLRLKRFHALAAGCIVGVRGLTVNLLVFAHFAAAPGGGMPLPAPLLALTLVVVVVGLVIAWFKDLPDMEGDRRHAIGTLPLRLGARRVVAMGVGALLATHIAVVAAGLVGITGLHTGVLVAGHAGLAAALGWSVRRLALGDPRSTAAFYRSIWKLFSAEYAVFAAAAVLA